MWEWKNYCEERGTDTYCGWEYTYTPSQKIPENFSAIPIILVGLIIILFVKGRNK